MKINHSIPGCMVLAALIMAPLSQAQVVNGIDYSKPAKNPANTFEMTNTDILGQRFASEYLTLKDEVTGAQIIALTTSRHSNSKYYQTHPSWTPDGRHIIFRSSRGGKEGERGGLAYAISMETYEITQVTTGDWGNELHLGWKKNRAYFFHDNQLKVLDLERLLSDSAQNKVGDPDSYLTVLATLPEGLRASGMGLDAEENRVFFNTRVDSGSAAIYSIDFTTGDVTKLIDVPFRIGHLQANPYVTGELLYCWETGGDAVQRMWYLTVGKDGSVNNRPIYVEKPTEWVTHELFTDADHILFNVMAHLDRLRENPTGIFSLNIRTNAHTNHGQIQKGGFWHCDGSENGKWVVGDSFDGDLYRIDTGTGKQTLLTTGHRPNSEGPFTKEAHSHHNISPDNKWVLLNSSMLTESDIMLIPLHPDKHTGLPGKP